MALLDVALAAQNVVFINSTQTYSQADLLALDLVNAQTIVVTGGGTLNMSDLLGVNLIKSSHIVVTGGSTVNMGAGLLDVTALNSLNIVVDGDSTVNLSASGVALGTAVTNLLNNINVQFTGSGDGTFAYHPPNTLALAASATINVTQMGAGDRVIVPFANGSNATHPNSLREASPVYQNGKLRLTNGGLTVEEILAGKLLSTVNVNIEMPSTDRALYNAAKDNYLKWATDTFIYPGDDSSQPPYEGPCFTPRTMIATLTGDKAVEDLQVGDLVLTQDCGPQQIRWISHHPFNGLDLFHRPHLRPIRIAAGALGENMPDKELIVSPQHRMLLRSKIAAKLFGENEVLVAAKHLTSLPGIEIVYDLQGVDYYHFMLEGHAIVFANGAPTESLYFGPYMHHILPQSLLEEIFEIFPELADQTADAPRPARQLLNGTAARKLTYRHSKHDELPLIAPLEPQRQHALH